MANSAPMMERMGMAMPGMTTPGMGMGMGLGMPTPSMPMPPSMNLMMVPRCIFKMEKCKGGMKLTCTCDDPMALAMVQNLCTALAGSMCSCSMMMNGMMVCCCNLTMGMCKAELTDKGMCLTCTSGDTAGCEMIQACCECLSCMLKSGCMCCLLMNSTPVCCGCC